MVSDEHGCACTNIARAANGDLLSYSRRRLLRSKDGRKTWTVYQKLAEEKDFNPFRLQRLTHSLELHPPSTIQVAFSDDHGKTWSEDEGRTWTPMARGAFPMYACTNAMITTASGVVLVGGRFPGIAVQASFDDGMT